MFNILHLLYKILHDRFVDCIDSDGDACDGCLGKGFNCNTKTYDQCDDVTVDGANWCGSTEGKPITFQKQQFSAFLLISFLYV
jgi:hypothetical protein